MKAINEDNREQTDDEQMIVQPRLIKWPSLCIVTALISQLLDWQLVTSVQINTDRRPWVIWLMLYTAPCSDNYCSWQLASCSVQSSSLESMHACVRGYMYQYMYFRLRIVSHFSLVLYGLVCTSFLVCQVNMNYTFVDILTFFFVFISFTILKIQKQINCLFQKPLYTGTS